MTQASTLEPHLGLAERAAQGDRAAAGTLCERFVPAVRAFARRRLVTTEAVDEFTQDVMLVLLEALGAGKLEDPARLPGFVLGICKNLARDRARQRERRTGLLATYAAEFASFAPATPEKPTYEIMHLEDCLVSLSARAREMVRLAYGEAASPAEIARALAVSEGNARVLRHRTLAALRECMSRRMSWEAA